MAIDEMFPILTAHKDNVSADCTEIISTSSSTQKEIYKAVGIKKPV